MAMAEPSVSRLPIVRRSKLVRIGAQLEAQGLSLRPERREDDAFLLALFRSTREAEMAMAGWDENLKRLFVSQQFAAQRNHYRATITGCSFDVILHHGAPVGRLYTEERVTQVSIVDIALTPEMRGKGWGTALLTGVIAGAATAGKGVGIFVERFNPAQNLYRRLGFVEIADHGVYLEMEYPTPMAATIS